ncbi:ATP synthase F1 subunit epsilon [Candidatus Falkowbacteria bacterium]|uniref:ATP synthase epsilon chain n=1 Tax=Candidatus Falkowbacteria bacterium CG10_big_fil_rev_8_21_14_0_10_37_18 TaxID=1974562 RepID=A0A2H0V963_9BACT|nr:ATP synthase F1 subunit epsilon [Candidatus Falkowbacteria bacterium]NCQ12733.1 ATP synthase F1 subunit epsilon [Candidatus Falkowbacteria bacterium]OIO05370.1 MAG: ATP synthase F1 subunit epsilon [Candidatus Falkowbacteria bacterium CG1_02_37_21]PIR95601.1 MAG: ATP synthase F1 subunit epsilon [Candidatus Falkowbacteria bacterium CG10_big_fil_rev_8_21_14_0_10_37_18]
MSVKTIKFEIVTPERVVLQREVLQITIPTTSGEITILPNHIPLVSVLQAGVIETTSSDNEVEIMSVSGGFVEVSWDKVVILADTAERAEELDEGRINEAHKRAAELRNNAKDLDEVQFANISAQLEKEFARSRAVNRWRRLKGINNKN